jgi:type II secretory pathway pseudopilin PulG
MTGILRDKRGFTLVEVIFVAVITVMVIGAILSSWIFTYKAWTTENRRTQLRVDLLKALETIKKDLRLSSLTYIAFYPPGAEPYTAISLPVAETGSNGLYPLNANGNIVWGKTVIYHPYSETDGTTTLRRTVIDPRDNTLTDDERETQLANIVTSGGEGAGQETDTGFLRNVSDFSISSLSPFVDFYTDSSTPERAGKVVFGWAKLSSGDHTFRFEITGKNASSSGYAIGLDTLMIEPSGSVREAEYYSGSFAPSDALTLSGASASPVNDTVFSNHNYLEFNATAVGDYLEITDGYDLWRESPFDNSALDNIKMTGQRRRAALEVPESGDDGTITWLAYAEAGDSDQDGDDRDLPGGVSPPVVLRTVVSGDNISDDGDLMRVKFTASSGQDLDIEEAYITEKDTSGSDDYNGLPNQSTSGKSIEEYHRHQQIFFEDTTGAVTEDITIPADSEEWSVWTAYPIRSGTDYFITIYIEDTASDRCTVWDGASGTDRTFYLTGSAYSTSAGEPDWSGKSPSGSDDVYATASIDVWGASGSIESQIFDTTLTFPAYDQLKWSESSSAGTQTLLKVRTSSDEYMSGATGWDLISGSSSNPRMLSLTSDRYVQFLAEISAQPYWENAGGTTMTYPEYVDEQVSGPVQDFPSDAGGYLVTGMYSTWVDDVEISWPGEEKICTVTAYIARKNDYGQAKLLVDGEELVKILSVGVTVEKQLRELTITEHNTVEVEPRNTGK